MIDHETAKIVTLEMEAPLQRLNGLAVATALASLAIADGDPFHALAGCIREAHDEIKACHAMLQQAIGLQGPLEKA